MNNKKFKTLCVILHYGSERYTNECVKTLTEVNDLDIVISDNDPAQSYQPPKKIIKFVNIIRTGGSVGFSKGNNLGVNRYLTDDHGSVLILNNDTVVDKGAINLLRETLKISKVGAVGPCLLYTNDRNKVWACGGYINKMTLKVAGFPQKKSNYPHEVDYLPGAAILINANLWKNIKGFNEEYFLAYEEAELALEIKKKGFKIMADPRSIVLHHVGMSNIISPKYHYNNIRNKIIFAKYLYGKFLGFIYGLILTFLSNFKANSFNKIFEKLKIWNIAILDNLQSKPIEKKNI